MSNMDLFELLGLSFDPPEKNARLVSTRIDKKLAELGSALGREQKDREALQSQVDYLTQIASIILTQDKKQLIDQAFQPLADAKMAAELQSLKATVELLSITGGYTITESMIRHYKKETRLSEEHVTQVFNEAGFKIIQKNPLKAFPTFPINTDLISSQLELLRSTKDPNPDGTDTSVATDLYAFAAYLCNDIENVPMYRARDTKDLCSIFDTASRKFSQRNDPLGKLCGSLASSAKAYVFNSEENRAAYGQYLIYLSDELIKLFSTIKKAPEATLLNPKFADPCITKISSFFPEYEVALAIYNKEAEFTDTFYMPTNWVYTIKCSFCGMVNEFQSEEDAIRINACSNCKKHLFKKCDKCGKAVPVFMDSCPNCKYVFASVALFSKLYQQAEEALRKCDFDEARKQLFQAQTVAPGEKTRIDQLSKQINEEESVYKEPINRLRKLIAERHYQTARAELAPILLKYPNLDVSGFEKTIVEELSKADALYASASTVSPSRKADVCISILMGCSDHLPSLVYLRATAPEPCSALSITPDPVAGVINISWKQSTEQGVSYRLVRKNGDIGSTSENDGDIIAEDLTIASFVDQHVTPGRLYSYSVFALRMKIPSAPICRTGLLLSDVKNCRASQHGNKIRLTWDLPLNSNGAIVYRTHGSETVRLAADAHGSYEDANANQGTTYTYRICADYGNGRLSPGIEHVISLMLTIDSFTIQATHVKDSIYQVSWSIRQPGIDLRLMMDNKLLSEAKSEDGTAKVSLPQEALCPISVLASSGSKWISSDNTVEINTYTMCEIDKEATQLEEHSVSTREGVISNILLRIRLVGSLPDDIIGFYYTVRTDKALAKWATHNDLGKAADVQRMSISSYRQQGYLPNQSVAMDENAYFITVFCIYSSKGNEIVSEPRKLRIARPLNASVFWAVKHGLLDGLRLSIQMSVNRPIDYVPEFLLCICDEHQFITSENDQNAQRIFTIPSLELAPPQAEYRMTYKVDTDLSARILKKCRFFLFAGQLSHSDNIVIRWNQGFSGKV